jgi:phosphopantothenoylcysteine decarboxylase/phosphopantothenate--cysteine ligase
VNGKRILLIVGGGIAAYKSCELVRLIRRNGGAVTCVLTDGGSHFVTPMTLAALSENQVHTSLWDLKDEVEMGHIQLSRQADLVVVCPATADLLARMAAGIADDLATTLLLATDKKVLVAPAMNVRMWQHEATRRNVARLRADGVAVLEPDEGDMACGEFGPGRLPEPEKIYARIAAMLEGHATQETASTGPLSGRHVIVTAGPTHEPIDPVRVIANRSSGKQGFAIAASLAELGARVTLVAGPVSLPTPPAVDRVNVETGRQMQAAVEAALPADAAVLVAAVADWRVEAATSKLKKADGAPQLAWSANPDILAELARSPRSSPPMESKRGSEPPRPTSPGALPHGLPKRSARARPAGRRCPARPLRTRTGAPPGFDRDAPSRSGIAGLSWRRRFEGRGRRTRAW